MARLKAWPVTSSPSVTSSTLFMSMLACGIVSGCNKTTNVIGRPTSGQKVNVRVYLTKLVMGERKHDFRVVDLWVMTPCCLASCSRRFGGTRSIPSGALKRQAVGFSDMLVDKQQLETAICAVNVAGWTTPLLYILLLLLVRWHYSPMRTFASLMDCSQSPLFYDFSSQFLILHLLIPACT